MEELMTLPTSNTVAGPVDAAASSAEAIAAELARLEEIAQTYSGHDGFNKQIIEYGFRAARPFFRGSTCLEMGSSDGIMTQLLADSFPELMVIDGSAKFIDQLRSMFASQSHVRFEHTLFETYTPEERFDTVIATHVFEHVVDPVAIAVKALDYLKPEGCMIVEVPNAFSFNRLMGHAMGLIDDLHQLEPGDHAVGHRRVYDPDWLRHDLTKAGWNVEVMTGSMFKPVANSQMERWFSSEMVEGCYKLGPQFARHAADIVAVCTPQ
jgi:2-polyprenyl-3-methyl-5-hydroxy-6-metoxy-1,4-benzoquinol methylase